MRKTPPPTRATGRFHGFDSEIPRFADIGVVFFASGLQNRIDRMLLDWTSLKESDIGRFGIYGPLGAKRASAATEVCYL
jgi:hypothetical protein